jgi:hypothetical protein
MCVGSAIISWVDIREAPFASDLLRLMRLIDIISLATNRQPVFIGEVYSEHTLMVKSR